MDKDGMQWQHLVEAGYDTLPQSENNVAPDETGTAKVEWISDLIDSYVYERDHTTIREETNSYNKPIAGDNEESQQSLSKCCDNDINTILDSTKQSKPELIERPIDSHGTFCRGFLGHLTMMRQSTSSTTDDACKLSSCKTDEADVEASTSFAMDVKGSSIIAHPDNHDDHTTQSPTNNCRSAQQSINEIIPSSLRSTEEDFADINDNKILKYELKKPMLTINSMVLTSAAMAKNKDIKNIENIGKKPKKCLLNWCSIRRLWSNDGVRNIKSPVNNRYREKDNTFYMPRTQVKHIQIKFKKT